MILILWLYLWGAQSYSDHLVQNGKVRVRDVCNYLMAVEVEPLRLDAEWFREKLVPLAPNLFVLGSPRTLESHELSSSQKYAKILRRHGETLVLVTHYKGREIPGYDGVIFDRSGVAIANYSVKSKVHGLNPYIAIMKGINKAQQFSQIDQWLTVRRGPDHGQDVIHVQSKERLYAFYQFGAWLDQALEIFGVLGSIERKCRVVVDLNGQGTRPSAQDLRDLRERLKDYPAVESVVLFSTQRNYYVEVSQDTVFKP